MRRGSLSDRRIIVPGRRGGDPAHHGHGPAARLANSGRAPLGLQDSRHAPRLAGSGRWVVIGWVALLGDCLSGLDRADSPTLAVRLYPTVNPELERTG